MDQKKPETQDFSIPSAVEHFVEKALLTNKTN